MRVKEQSAIRNQATVALSLDDFPNYNKVTESAAVLIRSSGPDKPQILIKIEPRPIALRSPRSGNAMGLYFCKRSFEFGIAALSSNSHSEPVFLARDKYNLSL